MTVDDIVIKLKAMSDEIVKTAHCAEQAEIGVKIDDLVEEIEDSK